jgi:type IV fimbrial biogenesis protein FimT
MNLPVRGYTLLELVAALAIALVLLGVAASAVGHGLEAARAGDARTHLLASLARAGSRAGITGTRAVVCSSTDGTSCSGTIDWSTGWIAFLDADADGEHDAGEQHLDAVAVLPGRVRLRSTVGRTRITFQGNGGNAGSNVTFTLCDGRGPARARSLVISNTGNLRDAPASAADAAATCAP